MASSKFHEKGPSQIFDGVFDFRYTTYETGVFKAKVRLAKSSQLLQRVAFIARYCYSNLFFKVQI